MRFRSTLGLAYDITPHEAAVIVAWIDALEEVAKAAREWSKPQNVHELFFSIQ